LGLIDKTGTYISIGGIQMLEREDNFTHPIEQFWIVRITPSDIAPKVIQQFNGNVSNHRERIFISIYNE